VITMIEKIRDEIEDISIIDTHEHICDRMREDFTLTKSKWDLFTLLKDSYVIDDLGSAGMPVTEQVIRETNPEKNWNYFKDHLPKVKNTSYYRNLISGIRELFEIESVDITEDNWREISERISEVSRRKDWNRYVLKERANVELALLDTGWDVTDYLMDRECFVPLLRIDPFLCGWDIDFNYRYCPSIRVIAERLRVPIDDFDDYLAFVEKGITNSIEKGGICIKLGVAYTRSLEFERVEEDEASRIFDKPDVTEGEAKRFEDFMVRYTAERSVDYELPIQIHTGIQARGMNILTNSNPLKLNPLLMDYPDAKFILFHGGYPFLFETGTLAKMFPNVFLDTCWIPLISTDAMRRCLDEWLDLVPANKFMWGGDTVNVVECYGHTRLVRKLVSEVLSSKVKKGDLKVDDAVDFSKMMFRENALDLFRLR